MNTFAEFSIFIIFIMGLYSLHTLIYQNYFKVNAKKYAAFEIFFFQCQSESLYLFTIASYTLVK